MKTNLALFGILVALLIGVYLDQEVYEKEERKQQLVEKSLLKQTDFQKFTFPNGSLEKDEGKWSHPEIAWTVDQDKVDEFIKIMHSIQVKHKILEFKLEDYFQKQKTVLGIKSSTYEGELWFGDSIEATGRFYVYQVNSKELFICEDTSYYNIPYSSERDYGLKKYLRLSKLLQRGADLFWQSNFILGLKLTELKRLQIDSVRNRPLEIDLISNKTIPQAPAPLDYKSLADVINKQFQEIQIVKIIASGQNYLSDQRSVIKLEGSRDHVLRYFSGLNEQFGKYVRVEGLDYIFQVEMKPRNIFFLTGNDFWVKNFHYDESISNLTKLDFSLSLEGENWKDFTIYDLENFKIKAVSKGVNFSKVHMNVLFNLLFNLVDFKEAIFVESIVENQIPSSNVLNVKFLGSKMVVWVEEDYIKVIDRKNKLLYHFPDAGDQIMPGFFRSAFTVNPN